MPRFRYIEEGKGNTLPIEDDVHLLGTWNLITCVGVYFKIDKARCFMAHINARTTTWPYNVVTSKSGEWIKEYVTVILFDLAKKQNWDMRDADFGEDLHTQCPCLGDAEFENVKYTRAGNYVVKAVREFFVSRADALEKVVKQRPQAITQSARESYPELVQKLERESERLEAKVAFLRDQGTLGQVDKLHHCFIVAPVSGLLVPIGNIWEKPMSVQHSKSALKEDIAECTPVPVPGPYNFFINAQVDVESDFPAGILALGRRLRDKAADQEWAALSLEDPPRSGPLSRMTIEQG